MAVLRDYLDIDIDDIDLSAEDALFISHDLFDDVDIISSFNVSEEAANCQTDIRAARITASGQNDPVPSTWHFVNDADEKTLAPNFFRFSILRIRLKLWST